MPSLPPGVHSEFPADRDTLTPLFRQYVQIKDGEARALLLYRLGDFYETFGPDALRISELLGLTLTSRGCAKDYKVAMAGVPHHSAPKYIRQLVEAGEVVALCEQMEEPSEAKGLVERAVTRVITAGTLLEEEYLSADRGNFLAVLARSGRRWAMALLESSGGQVELSEIELDGVEADSAAALQRRLADSLLRMRPAEVLLPEELLRDAQFTALLGQRGTRAVLGGPVLHGYSAQSRDSETREYLERQLGTAKLAALGLDPQGAIEAALAALLRYLQQNFRLDSPAIHPRIVPPEGRLYLDSRAAGHLDLLPGEAGQPGLYNVLNRCQSPAGRRELRRLLLSPFADAQLISARHDSVELLTRERTLAARIAELIAALSDIERIAQRVLLDKSNPRELYSLAQSLTPLALLREDCLNSGDALLSELALQVAHFDELRAGLLAAIAEDAPLKSGEPGVIRPGFDARVDELSALLSGGNEWFKQYEERERERTGIRTLRVKQTGPFGWFIEVGKASAALVPAEYKRRQTLVNAERFTTEELTRMEGEAGSALARLLARERELLGELLAMLKQRCPELSAAARAAAAIDVLQGLAAAAVENAWIRPEISAPGAEARLELTAARHPLVEDALGRSYFTPNDCWLSHEEQQIMLITGPNMGGKSTYLRMVALLAVMSQLGSFVPAQRALLPVFTRIYARVGAEDRLARGQSTFMVEMLETAEILSSCGPGSLILLDEVGRGTSTYDGISIAKAVLEFLHEHPARPLTLFATHFFELTDLPLLLPRAVNFHVEVAREGESFVFLYRVSPGAASDSFGIEVAALAGLPREVVQRARLILGELEEAREQARERARRAVQLGLFGEEKE